MAFRASFVLPAQKPVIQNLTCVRSCKTCVIREAALAFRSSCVRLRFSGVLGRFVCRPVNQSKFAVGTIGFHTDALCALRRTAVWASFVLPQKPSWVPAADMV